MIRADSHQDQSGDLLLTGALRLLAGDPRPTRTAVLCHNGRIAAVAPSPDEALAAARRNGYRIAPGTVVVDLNGALLVPGLHDCHVHLAATGRDSLTVDLRGCRSLDEVWSALHSARRAGLSQSGLLIGSGLNELSLSESRLPTLSELDRYLEGVPVLIGRVDGHSCVINSAAWKALDVPFPIGGPYGDGVETDPATGLPTGCLRAGANSAARLRLEALLTQDDRERVVLRGADLAADAGCTTVHCLEGGGVGALGDVDAVIRLQGRLPVRTVVYAQTTDVDWVLERGLSQVGGCLLVDGSIGSHTAALREPYADRPDTQGTLYFEDEELRAFLARAHAAGLQVALHTIGDAAIEQALAAWEQVLGSQDSAGSAHAGATSATRGPDRRNSHRHRHRHRLEHFSLPCTAQIERAVRLGLAFSVQPSWAYADNPYPAELGLRRLGPERSDRLYPLASLLRAGAFVCGGSDSPVAALDPIAGLIGAVRHFRPTECVRLEEAVSLFTANAALAGGPGLPARGRIRAGLAADLTIVGISAQGAQDGSGDVEPDPRSFQVLGTVLAGALRLNAAGRKALARSSSDML